MKTILTNDYNINWNDYITTNGFDYLEELKKYYTISDGNGNTDPCLECPYHGGVKDVFGNPIVGDSPCQWCQHYKWKVTW